MELLKLLSASEVFAQVLCFFVVLVLLKKFFWVRVLHILDDRKAHIEQELQRAEDVKAQTQQLKRDYEEKISLIQQEAKKILDETKKEACKTAEEIQKKAYADAETIILNTKVSMQQDLTKVRQALKDELISITLKAAENIIEEKLSEEQDAKIVEEFLSELDKTA